MHGRTFRNSAAAQLRVDVAHDPRRQPRLVHRRRRAVRAQRRLGARLRPVPRRDDGLRPARAVVLHPPGRDPAGRHRPARPPRPVRARTAAGRGASTRRHRRRGRCVTTPSRPCTPGDAHRHGAVAAARSSARRRSTSGAGGGSGSAISLVAARRSPWCRSGTRGLNLGIDFEGGVAWDVPGRRALRRRRPRRSSTTTASRATRPRSRSATPTAATSSRSRSTTSPRTCGSQLQEAFAEAAGVDAADVSVASVSSTWGEEITEKAIRRSSSSSS